MAFRAQGKVILMGDFNRRIGDQPTVYSRDNSQIIFERRSQDTKVRSHARAQGRVFLEAMNANDMFVMNGLDSGWEYTFESASVIDYIVLESRLVYFEQEEEADGLDYKHKPSVQNTSPIQGRP